MLQNAGPIQQRPGRRLDAVGERDERVAFRIQGLDAGDDVWEGTQVLVLLDEPLPLFAGEIHAENARGMDQSLASTDAEVLVLAHQGAPKGVLDLLVAPELAEPVRQLLPDYGLQVLVHLQRIDQRAVDVETDCARHPLPPPKGLPQGNTTVSMLIGPAPGPKTRPRGCRRRPPAGRTRPRQGAR